MKPAQSFQILDRRENIHQNLLLEASAGTGKTFSIENIVVRLLTGEHPLSLDQILVVTFTRAATRDLTARIHDNILFASAGLQGNTDVPIPDYLLSIREQGAEVRQRALRILERSIGAFDLAQIYTIHGFCAQMLGDHLFEGCFHGSPSVQGDALQMRPILRDYFRLAADNTVIAPQEWSLLLQYFSGGLDRLEQQLIESISKNITLPPPESLAERLSRFQDVMQYLKLHEGWSEEKILSDFHTLAPFYKELCDRKKQIKPEILSRVTAFASLFAKEAWAAADLHAMQEDPLCFLQFFDAHQRKVNAPSQDTLPLKLPRLKELLKERLLPIVSIEALFSQAAADCQRFVRSYKQKEGLTDYDDLLSAMDQALSRPDFVSRLRERYRAVIIDEFQDTDPIQWRIFDRLFVQANDPKPFVYLVGDPKQSIYAFRQADLYTYFEAAEKIGQSQHRSLDTNYRSQKELIDTLNFLFSEETSPGLFWLPKNQTFLIYPPVKSPSQRPDHVFDDEKGAVHFFGVEASSARKISLEKCEIEGFFPFVAHEILHLVEKKQFEFRHMALLVADRFQAARVSSYLSQWNIPSAIQKTGNLTDATAFEAMRELLTAVMYPADASALKTALGGGVFLWSYQDLLALEGQDLLQVVLKTFYFLRDQLFDRGFAAFYESLLATEWQQGKTTLEKWLDNEQGERFYQDFQQIADLLMEHECEQRCSPERLLLFLDQLQSYPEAHEAKIRRLEDPTRNAVQVLTTHSSKGLEFDLVFNLGLIKRSTNSALLIPEKKEGQRHLAPVWDQEASHYQSFCREVDAEKLRLLYVGFTRAKKRLYNAVVFSKEEQEVAFGTASPMDLFLAHLGKSPPKSIEELYLRMHGCSAQGFQEFVSATSGISLSFSLLNGLDLPLHRYCEETQYSLTPPKAIYIPGQQEFVHSFTSLSVHSQKELGSDFGDPPHEFLAAKKSIHTLPVGTHTGNFLHECLESVPFEECRWMQQPSELSSLLRSRIEASPFCDWKEVIYQLVFRAIKTPFVDGVALCDLSPNSYAKELEFLYGSSFEGAPGQIKGFMDLFFQSRGRYYLLDWKSNWLGPDEMSYTQEALSKAMEQHQYLLQAELYEQALEKYLKLFDPRPFAECFGGTYYVFLRGLGEQGVFVRDVRKAIRGCFRQSPRLT